jgi:molecular chaperone GrpE
MSEMRKIKILSRGEEESNHTSGASDMAKTHPGDADEAAEKVEASAEVVVRDLEARIEAKDKELKETYDRLLRVTAEYENYKKRMTREMDDFRKYANQALLKEMLSVVDHIELALQAASGAGSDNSLGEGLDLTLKELLRILEKFNVKPIDAVGKPFNPEFHEAILRETSEGLSETTVVREMQKGYMINQRLLRPSLVVVAVPKDAVSQDDADQCSN